MKTTLTSLKRFDKDRDGNALKTRDGRPYTRLVIETKEHPKSLSGFDSIQTSGWQIGQEVDIEVEQKGEYLNFKLPNKEDRLTKTLEEINGKMTKMNLMLTEIGNAVIPSKRDTIPGTDKPYPTPEDEWPNDESVPF